MHLLSDAATVFHWERRHWTRRRILLLLLACALVALAGVGLSYLESGAVQPWLRTTALRGSAAWETYRYLRTLLPVGFPFADAQRYLGSRGSWWDSPAFGLALLANFPASVAVRFVLPWVVGGVLAAKRERRWWDQWRLTRLQPAGIFLGAAAAAYLPWGVLSIAAAIIIAVPLAASGAPWEMTTYVLVATLLNSLCFTLICVGLSARCRRTGSARVCAYAATLGLYATGRVASFYIVGWLSPLPVFAGSTGNDPVGAYYQLYALVTLGVSLGLLAPAALLGAVAGVRALRSE